ncbi:U2 small nuclear ribonucleoprotein auxiliary factor 35 kDa subunit-related protein 2, partial [Elysia marginata]
MWSEKVDLQNNMATLMDDDLEQTLKSRSVCTNTANQPQLSDSSTSIMRKPDHMNHKKWKAYLKKMKRKKKRAELAKEREANLPVGEEEPTDSEEERRREEEEEERSLRQNLLWMQREREAQAAFKAKLDWEEKEKRRKEEIERKIKEEWAERERKEKEEQEAKEKKETEKREKQ